MELKGFDDKKSPVVTIIGGVVAVLVAFWILKRILSTLFLLLQIGVFVVLLVAAAAWANRWLSKRENDKTKPQ